MSKLRTILRLLLNGNISLQEVTNKAQVFLSPQVSYIKNEYSMYSGHVFTDQNKVGVISISGIGYAIAIAEELSKYRVASKDRMGYLLNIFGQEYEDLFRYLIDLIGGQNSFSLIIEDERGRAKEDIKQGVFNSSNFLVSCAEGMESFNGNLEYIYRNIIQSKA